jgi:hypothetical protein
VFHIPFLWLTLASQIGRRNDTPKFQHTSTRVQDIKSHREALVFINKCVGGIRPGINGASSQPLFCFLLQITLTRNYFHDSARCVVTLTRFKRLLETTQIGRRTRYSVDSNFSHTSTLNFPYTSCHDKWNFSFLAPEIVMLRHSVTTYQEKVFFIHSKKNS